MPRTSDKRDRLINAARDLIHQHGYNQTTLADIAEESGVPLGNVYYYFKTKDEIAAAVLKQRELDFAQLFASWENLAPRQRINKLVEFLAANAEPMAEHGCPVGSLCQELNKQRNALSAQADSLLQLQLDWLITQFRDFSTGEKAKENAMYLLAFLQGSTLLANSLHDPEVLRLQVKQIKRWLKSL